MGFAITLRRRLRASHFLRNVGVLTGATAMGQGAMLLASPVLTRLYTPDDFGALAVYTSLLGVLAVVAAMRFEQAIPIADEDSAFDVLRLALVVVLVVAGLLVIGISVLGNEIRLVMGGEAMGPYVWFVPLGVALVGSYNTFMHWAIRTTKFSVIARTQLRQALGSVFTQLGLGVIAFGPLGLVVGQIVGLAAGISGLYRTCSSARHGIRLNLSSLLATAHRYWRFPALGAPAALLNELGLQLPTIFLASAYGPQVAGWMLLSRRVLSAPLALLGRSVGQVYLGEASRLAAENASKMRPLFVKTTLRLLLMVLLPISALAVASPWLFTLTFGDEWKQAGVYARYLSLMAAAQFISTPTSQTFVILERQDISLAFNMAKAAIALGSLALPARLAMPPDVAIGAYSLCMAAYYVVVVLVSLRIISRQELSEATVL